MAKSAADVAAKWATNLGAAGDAITAGVNAVTVAPGAKAAAASTLWIANVTASKAKFEKNSSAVSLASWKNDMITKGIPRIATGAQAAQPKVQAFMTAFLPAVASSVASLPPRGTFQQNLQRMTAHATNLHSFQYTRPAS